MLCFHNFAMIWIHCPHTSSKWPQKCHSLINYKIVFQEIWFHVIYASLVLLFLSEFFFYPLLGCTKSQGRCWAAIRLSHQPERSGCAVYGEVDGLDIGGWHGQRFVLLCHTHTPQRRPNPICTSRSGNVWHRCGGDWAGTRLFLGGSFREGGCRCQELKCRVLWGCPPTSHSIDDPPTVSHVCCCCQKNWWVAVWQVKTGVLIWGDMHLHSMDGRVLSGAGVQAPWHSVLEIV